MRLNPDCVRAILMSVEAETSFDAPFWHSVGADDHKMLQKYTHDEIIYHIRQCKMSNFIGGCQFFDDGASVQIADLLPDGHTFLANIRDDNIWTNVKGISKTIGANSLSALCQIAAGVITAAIQKHLGL